MKVPLKNIQKLLQREIDPAFTRRAKIILENLDLKPGMRVLEIGCGRGFYEAAISRIYPRVAIIGIDSNNKYLEIARRSIKSPEVSFIQADATKLPFRNGEFDRIICTEVLEHIEDDDKVISEIYRMLKSGGRAIITVPNKNYPILWDPLNFLLERLFNWHIPSNIWWLAGIWADHVRLFTEEELIRKIKNSGLKIDNLWRSTHFCIPFSHFILYGIGKNIVEAGLSSSFNRFVYNTKPSHFVRFSRYIVYLRDYKNNRSLSSNESFINIIAKVAK